MTTLPHSIHWQMKLGELGAVVQDLDDIAQSLRIILGTPTGTVPHRPEFGLDSSRFMDLPVSQLRAPLSREVLDAVAAWEPRARALGVTIEPAPGGVGLGVRVVLRWRPVDGVAEQLTEATL